MTPRLAHRARFTAAALIASAALVLTGCTGSETLAPSGDVSTLDAGVSGSIDAAVEAAMAQSGSTEAVVGVWSGDSAHVRGFGDGIDGTTRFRGAQATQPMVCALLLGLVAEGTIDLDRQVSEDLTRQSGIEDITYRQLCTNQSGLADYKSAFSTIFTNNPTRYWPEQELIAQSLTKSPLKWPGLNVNISDTNPLVLGRALYVETRTSLSELLQTHVYTPAEMSSSYFPAATSTSIDGDTLHGLTYPARVKNGKPDCKTGVVEVPEVSPSVLGGAGATVTTVTDLKNFYSHYLDGTFGGESAGVVTETLPVKNPKRNKEGEPTSELDTEGPQWAFGMEKVGPLYGHSGAITGTLSAAYHDPASDFTVVVSLNNSSAGAEFAQALAFQLAAISAEGGSGPELSWTAADQEKALAKRAVCQ